LSTINHTYFKLKMLEDFLAETANARAGLLKNAVDIGNFDQVKSMRRLRMLRQLSEFEAQIVDKIYNLKVNSINEYLDQSFAFIGEISTVVNRDA